MNDSQLKASIALRDLALAAGKLSSEESYCLGNLDHKSCQNL
jgi:hypothetical protein